MDAIDILGALLGRKTQQGGSGGQILKDQLGGNRPAAPSTSADSRRPQRPMTVEESAKSLEDLLNVATVQQASRRQAPASPVKPTAVKPVPTPIPHRVPTPPEPTPPVPAQPQLLPELAGAGRANAGRPASVPMGRASLPERAPVQDAMNEQAMVLVRAMVSAAKSDGQITEEEQNAIIKQLGHAGDAEINFLRQEFASPLNVRELAWSIPLGMEDQAYAISLIAINLDEQSEAQYLGELAHGLRLTPDRCNEIHRQYGAPEIFR